MTYRNVCISSGHGLYLRGASGVLDEVDEARRVVECVAGKLEARGVTVTVFHDNTSKTQDDNLHTIVDFHNDQQRELDVSVHFNAYVETTKAMGCEVLYVTQAEVAGDLSGAISDAADLIDRGAKKRSDLYFLNNTDMPALLIETCFVDSTTDADCYRENFDAICEAIAGVLGGKHHEEGTPPPEEISPPTRPALVRLDIDVEGDVSVIINGVPVT